MEHPHQCSCRRRGEYCARRCALANEHHRAKEHIDVAHPHWPMAMPLEISIFLKNKKIIQKRKKNRIPKNIAIFLLFFFIF